MGTTPGRPHTDFAALLTEAHQGAGLSTDGEHPRENHSRRWINRFRLTVCISRRKPPSGWQRAEGIHSSSGSLPLHLTHAGQGDQTDLRWSHHWLISSLGWPRRRRYGRAV